VLEDSKEVYKNDTIARKMQMTAEDQLHFHQTESGPVMESLHEWFPGQFEINPFDYLTQLQ